MCNDNLRLVPWDKSQYFKLRENTLVEVVSFAKEFV